MCKRKVRFIFLPLQYALDPLGTFILKLVQSQLEGFVNDCEDLLTHNPDVMRQLEDGDFAVVIFDQIWPCSLFLAMKLNAKAVMSSPLSTVAIISGEIGNPLNLAITPEAMTTYTNRMSFTQVYIQTKLSLF